MKFFKINNLFGNKARKKSSATPLLILCGCALIIGGCSSKKETPNIYYLNFKPEAAHIWEEIATEYTKQTGIPVKVLTASGGNYEQTLKAEIAKRDAPTLFQINGPVGYQNWHKYCLDLKDTKLYSWLLDPSLAVTGSDGGVYGIPYVVEGYGIIYNDAIMQKYFQLSSKKTSYKSMDEINSFAKLKEVVEDMTADTSCKHSYIL